MSGSQNLYFSGRVAFEDGTVPKDAKVVIESVCSGKVNRETTVDTNGGFGFTLGKGTDSILNASNTDSRVGGVATNPAECILRAALNGYTSDMVYLASIDKGKSNVGTIILRKNAAAPAPAPVSATSKAAPKDAKKAFEKGVEAGQKNKSEDAIKQFQKAVELYPAYAEAWYLLARLQSAAKQPEEARKSLETAVKTDGKYIAPAYELAKLQYSEKNWKSLAETASLIEKAAAELPDPGTFDGVPQAYLLHALASANQGDNAGADKVLAEGQKLDLLHKVPKMWLMRGQLLAGRADFTGAAENFRKYLEYSPMASDAEQTKQWIAECEKRMAAAQPK
jgi:TolA-binding protein